MGRRSVDAELEYAYFQHVDEAIVEAYPIGSEGALRLAADEDWVEVDGPDGGESVSVSAAAAKLAEEAGIDLSGVEGTGKGGSITKGDVQAVIDAENEADGGESDE